MKVLSLCDGMSIAHIALDRIGMHVNKYYAAEIKDVAIKVTKDNYPDTIHIGDVNKVRYKGGILYTENGNYNVGHIDLMVFGSPCQSFSIAMKTDMRIGLKDKVRSGLFLECYRILQEVQPTWFLLENVASMNEESKGVISELLGCQPIFIDSKLFSAQQRPRYYWTNIPIESVTPPESPLVLEDIMESEVAEKYFYSHPLADVDMKKQVCATMVYKNHEIHKRIFNPAFKCHTLTTCGGGNTQKKVMDHGRARKLTPLEYERLQTLPDNYTAGVSDGARYTAIGNGWTVDVIAYILRGMKE